MVSEKLSEVLTAEEAASFIRVSEKTLRQMARLGHLPAQKAGREWRFLRSALESWLANPRLSYEVSAAPVGSAIATKATAQTKNGFADSAFTENRDRPLHRWVPWVAGFSAGFVADVLSRAPQPPGVTVMDPFAGVGTTPVEAMRRGFDVIGFEINPFAHLACRVKLSSVYLDAATVRDRSRSFCEYVALRAADPQAQPTARPPADFRSRVPFFSPSVERQVLFALDFLAQEPDEAVRDVLRLALGATLVSYSNYSYEPSLSRRATSGKPDIVDANVPDILALKLEQMCQDIVGFQQDMRALSSPPTARLYLESCLDGYARLKPGSVDVLITSPPYLNNYHYLRNTRPQLHWLNLIAGTQALRDLETRSFGKFWQTVRAGPREDLLVDYPELAAVIAGVRESNPGKGVYGGAGWANYAATYFNDCARFCEGTARVMKQGGLVVVVIGNNILQGREVKTDEFFAGIAERYGFVVRALHRVRQKRTGSSIVNSSVRVNGERQATVLYETAVELTAPGP
jgi:excisionase family DNA binding protein